MRYVVVLETNCRKAALDAAPRVAKNHVGIRVGVLEFRDGSYERLKDAIGIDSFCEPPSR